MFPESEEKKHSTEANPSSKPHEAEGEWWTYFLSKDFWLINLYWFIGGCILLFLVLKGVLPIFTNPGKVKPLPNWTGKHLDAALREVEEMGLSAKIDSTYVIGKPPLIVLKQVPEAGKKVKTNSGRTIYLTVNQSVPPLVDDIPCYEDFIHSRDYTLLLKQKGLGVRKMVEVPPNGPDAPGRVLKVVYKGKELHCRRSRVVPNDSVIVFPSKEIHVGDEVDLYVVAETSGTDSIDAAILKDLQEHFGVHGD
jgi:hypothetical protein